MTALWSVVVLILCVDGVVLFVYGTLVLRVMEDTSCVRTFVSSTCILPVVCNNYCILMGSMYYLKFSGRITVVYEDKVLPRPARRRLRMVVVKL